VHADTRTQPASRETALNFIVIEAPHWKHGHSVRWRCRLSCDRHHIYQ
jgi:hypothetical protein